LDEGVAEAKKIATIQRMGGPQRIRIQRSDGMDEFYRQSRRHPATDGDTLNASQKPAAIKEKIHEAFAPALAGWMPGSRGQRGLRGFHAAEPFTRRVIDHCGRDDGGDHAARE
jgi:hypothetical protein